MASRPPIAAEERAKLRRLVAVCRQCVANVDAGRLQVREGILPEDERARTTGGFRVHVRTDVKVEDVIGDEWEVLPVRVAAAWSADGLHVKFVNEGRTEYALDPVAMRYACAERFVRTIEAPGRPTTTERDFRIQLGMPWWYAVVPARNLVVLRAGATLEFDLPVRPELRGAPHLELELESYEVPRSAPATVLRFEPTPVF